MSGKVYAVASGKGGVGKTTTVVNLGVTLRADDHSVALVDADLGMANLGSLLGIDHEPTLHGVLADEASIDDALTEQADRFGILPGARDLRRYAAADPGRLGEVIETLAGRYEFVLVDTGAGVGYEDVLPLELVDEVVLVATPDRAALGDAKKTAEIAELTGASVRGVVVTRTDGDDGEAIAQAMGVDYLASVPDDPVVPESTAAGRPLEAHAPDSPAAAGYRELAAELTGQAVERFEPQSVTTPTTEGSESDGDPADGDAERTVEGELSTDASVDEPEDDEDGGEADDPAVADVEDVPGDREPTDEVEADASEAAVGDEGSEDLDDGESADDVEERGAPESEDDAGDGETIADDGDETIAGDSDETIAGDDGMDATDEETSDEVAEDEAGSDKSGGILSRLGGLFR